MGLKVPYGEVDLKSIRKEGYIYIDKTMYIEKLEQEKKAIFTRPRRFGKTMLTNMLSYYYDINEAQNFEEIFKGLYVYDNPTPYKNKYYVLNFNFSGMDAGTENSLEEMNKQFANIVEFWISRFISKYKFDIQLEKKTTAAEILREMLKEFTKLNLENKIYIIIDEYDHFTNGMLRGNAKEFRKILGDTGLVRSFYEVIKDNLEIMNPPIERFFATGVAPVTLDSLTSGFNITTKITNKPQFNAMCGFTDEEVEQAIEMAGITGNQIEKTFNKMKENYDGYQFSKATKEHLFNSTLVMYYLKDLVSTVMPPENLVDGNLAATGSKIENIAGLIDSKNNYDILSELLLNGYVEGNIVDSFELNLYFDRDDFLSMLYYNGYLTIKEVGVITKLGIPNYVTEVLYASYFTKLTKLKDEYKIDTTELSLAMQEIAEHGNIDKITAKVQEFLFHTSVRDKECFNEMNLKHVYSMLLAYTSQYITYGEYPAGQGFLDVYMKKTANSLAKYEVVLELKYIKQKDIKKVNDKKIIKLAKEQMEKYMQDKRMLQKENLKKFVVIFKGFEKYYIEEI